MLSPTLLARFDSRIRRCATLLPPLATVALYSGGRQFFLDRFAASPPRRPVTPPAALACSPWGLEFRSPLLNAAGMFKKGEGYEVTAAQGAGAYLAGTTTRTPRKGNLKNGIRAPFAPYPRSGAASNWLGLPNPGHRAVAARMAKLEPIPGFPRGASLAVDSGPRAENVLEGLIEGLEAYHEAGVDFVEFNESCPNTEHSGGDGDRAMDALASRLEAVSEGFLAHRTRRLPVLVKLSTDTDPARLPELIDLLIGLGFDGLVLGNTSTAYADLRGQIAPLERRLYDRFVRDYGGGLSGRPLRAGSLALIQAGAAHLDSRGDAEDFHLVRVGGVESAQDVRESLEAGASLVQWYTGYFEAFARRGHGLYRRLYGELEKL